MQDVTTTTIITYNDNYERALGLARGCYQRNLIRQVETLGGSTLRGRAKLWSSRYAASARALLGRLSAAGIEYQIRRGPRGGWNSAVLEVTRYAVEC